MNRVEQKRPTAKKTIAVHYINFSYVLQSATDKIGAGHRNSASSSILLYRPSLQIETRKGVSLKGKYYQRNQQNSTVQVTPANHKKPLRLKLFKIDD